MYVRPADMEKAKVNKKLSCSFAMCLVMNQIYLIYKASLPDPILSFSMLHAKQTGEPGDKVMSWKPLLMYTHIIYPSMNTSLFHLSIAANRGDRKVVMIAKI